MRKFIFFILFGALQLWVYSQSAERYVVSSSGGSFISGSNLHIDYTVGEVAISTLQSPNNILTQGFQQPFTNLIIGIIENPQFDYEISMFPNPTDDQVNLLVNNISAGTYMVVIYDVLGQKVMQKSVSTGNSGSLQTRLELSDLATGRYFLRVVSGKEIIAEGSLIKVNQ